MQTHKEKAINMDQKKKVLDLETGRKITVLTNLFRNNVKWILITPHTGVLLYWRVRLLISLCMLPGCYNLNMTSNYWSWARW